MGDEDYRRIFSSKLKHYMQANGKNQMDLMNDLKLSSSTVSSWCTGQKLPRMGKIQMLADYFGINKSDLLEDKPDSAPLPGNIIPFGYAEVPPMDDVPLVGDIACGTPITAEENIRGRISVPSYWGATFVLTCHGDSMAPKILDGDLVAIHAQPEVENGQIAAVRIDGEATLKRVYHYPDRLELRAINPDFESIFLFGEDINNAQIDGRAIGLCRGL